MLTGTQRATEVIEFIETFCVYTDGILAGQYVTLRDWQKEPLRHIFGVVDEDGLREVQSALLIWNKKTGKTTVICAGVALYMMTLGAEPGSKVFAAANGKEQSAQLFEACAKMIRMSPRMRDLGFDPDYDISDYKHEIRFPGRDSQLKAVSREAGIIHGAGPSLLLVDEIHAMRDRGLMDALDLGMSKWREPLTIQTTNHGDVGGSPVYWEEKARADKWLSQPESERDPAYYASVYETDASIADEDVLTEGPHWKASNPHLGDFMSYKYLRNQVKSALELPSKAPNVLRFHFGRPVQAETAWLKINEWDACEFAPARTAGITDGLTDYEIVEKELEGRECFMGCDLSSQQDTTANVYLFPDSDGGFTMLEKIWLPAENIMQLEKRCQVPLSKWAKEGYITLTPNVGGIDYAAMRGDILAKARLFNIRVNGMDQWNAAETSVELHKAGLQTIYVGQTNQILNEPCKSLETLIRAGKFRHLKNPATRWMASVVLSPRTWGWTDANATGPFSILVVPTHVGVDRIEEDG